MPDDDRKHQENQNAIARLATLVDSFREEVCGRLGSIEESLTGDVGGEVLGLHARVRRLEEDSKNRKAWTMAAVVTALGAGAKAIWDLLFDRH